MNHLLAILAVLATVLFMGCGSTSSPEPSPTTTLTASAPQNTPIATIPLPAPTATRTVVANQDNLAASILLTLQDFPTGWSEGEDEEEEENPFDECDTVIEGRLGRAETRDFSSPTELALSGNHTVAVSQGTEEGRAALATVASRGDCLVKVINDGKLDDEESSFSDASLRRVSFPIYGDITEAWRIQAQIKSKTDSGDFEFPFYMDVVLVLNGRVGFIVSTTSVFNAIDPAQIESLVQKANAKVRQ